MRLFRMFMYACGISISSTALLVLFATVIMFETISVRALWIVGILILLIIGCTVGLADEIVKNVLEDYVREIRNQRTGSTLGSGDDSKI